jgi:GNAT superfamily N-acetyltransferase
MSSSATDESDAEIGIATSAEAINACFRVLVQLRRDLQQATFVERIQELGTNGYRLASLKQSGIVRAVAGFRLGDMLFTGPYMYVDDLVTDESVRSRGYGGQLLDWLFEFARSQGCSQVDLDSGIQRLDAHRFYRRKLMQVTDYHFCIKL